MDAEGFKSFAALARAKRLGAEHWSFRVKSGDVDGAVAEVNAGGGQYGGAVQPEYTGWVDPPSRPLLVADLFGPALGTGSNLIRSVREPGEASDDTGPADEGAPYGQAIPGTLSFDDQRLQDCVGLMAASEDILADAPSGAAYVTRRLGYLCRRAEEDVIAAAMLSASSVTGEEATTYTQASGEPLAVALANLSMMTYLQGGLVPSFLIVSPATAFASMTERSDAGGLGQFLAGPASLAQRGSWGMRLVVSPAVDSLHAIVGSAEAGNVWRHSSGLRVESSTGYGTFFGEGLVAIRGKVRSALETLRPSGFGVLTLHSESMLEGS